MLSYRIVGLGCQPQGGNRWRCVPCEPTTTRGLPDFTDESHHNMRAILTARLKEAKRASIRLGMQIHDVGVVVEELEIRSQATAQKLAREALRTSVEIDHCVGDLALKSYAPLRSRLLTEVQYKEWTDKLHQAEDDHDMAVRASLKLDKMKEALTEYDRKIEHLRKPGTRMGLTFTNLNKMRGSYHYFLHLSVKEAMMVVASQHGVLTFPVSKGD